MTGWYSAICFVLWPPTQRMNFAQDINGMFDADNALSLFATSRTSDLSKHCFEAKQQLQQVVGRKHWGQPFFAVFILTSLKGTFIKFHVLVDYRNWLALSCHWAVCQKPNNPPRHCFLQRKWGKSCGLALFVKVNRLCWGNMKCDVSLTCSFWVNAKYEIDKVAVI